MRVQRMLVRDESESWTVLDGDGEPVGVVEAFLAHLQALDRSPTTLRTSLKLWLQFLEPLGVAVDEARVENVSRFVGWLRAPAENVAVFDRVAAQAPTSTGRERGLVGLTTPLFQPESADDWPFRCQCGGINESVWTWNDLSPEDGCTLVALPWSRHR